jgi:hypothetical protein
MKKLLAAMFVALLIAGWVVDEKQPTTLTNQASSQTLTEKAFPVQEVSLEDNEPLNKIIAEAIDDTVLRKKGINPKGWEGCAISNIMDPSLDLDEDRFQNF